MSVNKEVKKIDLKEEFVKYYKNDPVAWARLKNAMQPRVIPNYDPEAPPVKIDLTGGGYIIPPAEPENK